MTLYLDDGDIRLYHGHVLDELRAMPDASVDCVVTSPPYYGLRDYGVDGQIGLEATPALFLATLVNVFREVRRVLADHGTCWVNLGDSYSAGYSGMPGATSGLSGIASEKYRATLAAGHGSTGARRVQGFAPKNLLGMPWRLAFALQDDGWILRRDIIWAKPNPMPESVTDRCTSAHEYVFMLTKSNRAIYWTHEDGRIAGPVKPPQEYRVDAYGKRVPLWTGHDYWYDADAVREPAEYGRREGGFRGGGTKYVGQKAGHMNHGHEKAGTVKGADPTSGRNLRSVWEIATQPTPEAHFATYPEELVRRCVLAGCPLEVCRECGKPRERLVKVDYELNTRTGGVNSTPRAGTAKDGPVISRYGMSQKKDKLVETLGWSDCGHDAYRRGVVLDPFTGSGTTAKVARDHERHAIGIDLNAEYLDIAAKRLQQLSLLGGTA